MTADLIPVAVVLLIILAVVMLVTSRGGRRALRRTARWWAPALPVALLTLMGLWPLAVVLAVVLVVMSRRRARRRTALAEGRAIPARVQRQASTQAQTGAEPPFQQAEIFAVTRLQPATWPAVAHGCGLSVRDHRMDGQGQGVLAAAAVLIGGVAAMRDRAVIMEADRAYVTPRLLGPVMTAPTGPVARIALLPGQTPATVAARAEALAAALRVPAVHVHVTEADAAQGSVTLSLRTREALTAAPVGVPAPAQDLAAVPYGIGEDGHPRTLSLANLSGWAIGGVPGSGKTAALTHVAGALIQNDAVQVAVLDAKGGSDWAWIEPRAALFSNHDEDLARLGAVVDQVHELMRHRLATQKSERGSANFWNRPLDPEHPAIVVLIDECQTIFETAGMNKDEKAIAESLRRRVSALVKKGRSAGIITVLMTQKPTSDALPTAIRDNCGLRTSFRVLTREAAESVLGAIPAGTEIMPTDIAAGTPGVAVVTSDRGGFERVRYGYLSEEDAETLANETAHLRRPLTDFLPTTHNEGDSHE